MAGAPRREERKTMRVREKGTPIRRRWSLARWLGAEDGSTTVEAVLWIPFFLLLLALVADASLLFHRQAQMLRAVQDANRAFSTGQFTSPADVQATLLAQYAPLSASVRAVSELDTATVPGGIIRTSLSVPARDVAGLGLIASLTDFTLTVTSQHYREF
jgi:Flp pilus assembly protein TadG